MNNGQQPEDTSEGGLIASALGVSIGWAGFLGIVVAFGYLVISMFRYKLGLYPPWVISDYFTIGALFGRLGFAALSGVITAGAIALLGTVVLIPIGLTKSGKAWMDTKSSSPKDVALHSHGGSGTQITSEKGQFAKIALGCADHLADYSKKKRESDSVERGGDDINLDSLG